MLNRRGSLALEALISLFVYTLITCLLVGLLRAMRLKQNPNWSYFDLGCMQLQELLAMCEIQEIERERLEILCNKEEYELVEHQGRLVKKEGYQIMLSNVADLSFELVEETIVMRGSYQNEAFEVAIAKREWWRQ